MDESDQVVSLLREVRDLQRDQLDEYRAQASRSLQLAEESVARQQAMASLYRKVVGVGAVLIVVLLGFLWWIVS